MNAWHITNIIITDVFKFDPDFIKNEEKYREMKAEILGDDDEGSDDSDGAEEESEEETGGGSHFLTAFWQKLTYYNS